MKKKILQMQFTLSLIQATPEQITDEVAEMVTNIINEIAVCSKRIQHTLSATQTLLYMGYPIQILIGKVGKFVLGQLISKWLKEIYKNFATRACTNTAISRWRSPVTIALMQV